MITQQTAADIYSAYREIETAKKLLEDVAEAQEQYGSRDKKTEPCLKDSFGRLRHFQLGIPSGENAHRLFNVRPDLAETVIRAHIAEKEAELVAVQERAKLELANPSNKEITLRSEA